MTDEKLYQLCKHYGTAARHWRQKFTGLLPEVNRRRLHEKKGFSSIFVFAYKLAGLSEDQVRNALNLERRFMDKPALRAALVQGEVSLSKLARVVSIATVENDAELAKKAKILSKEALSTLVRDERQNGSAKPLFEAKSLPGQTFQLSAEVTTQLSELHAQGHDINQLLLEFLQRRKQEIASQKEELSKAAVPTLSRYIPAKTRAILKQEYGQKCSIHTCTKPAEEIHHTQRFSLSHTHDPKFLAPLCKAHHQIAHAIDQKVLTHRFAGVG